MNQENLCTISTASAERRANALGIIVLNSLTELESMINNTNLIALSSYLKDHQERIRPLFDMKDWIQCTECNTVGCLAGHAYMAGIGVKGRPMDVIQRCYVSSFFNQYVKEVFTNEQLARAWLFSGTWADYDNTLIGAVTRIDMLIDGPEIVYWHRHGESWKPKDIVTCYWREHQLHKISGELPRVLATQNLRRTA